MTESVDLIATGSIEERLCTDQQLHNLMEACTGVSEAAYECQMLEETMKNLLEEGESERSESTRQINAERSESPISPLGASRSQIRTRFEACDAKRGTDLKPGVVLFE